MRLASAAFRHSFKKILEHIREVWPWPDLGETGFFFMSLFVTRGDFESNCVELACCPHSQGDPGKCWSHPPGGPSCPAAPRTPGSAAPGRSGSRPAGSPRCRSGTASGPAGCCTGPQFLPQCIPEIPSAGKKIVCHSLRGQIAYFQILFLSFSSCVTFRKLLSFSEPQFYSTKSGQDKIPML